MSKMTWDQEGQKLYELGVEQAALFPYAENKYGVGVPWNGLINVTESPSGAEPTALYANDKKYGELLSNEEFGGSIEAYTYPEEFNACNGVKKVAEGAYIAQQTRSSFGMVYKNLIGNDTDGVKHGYKLHFVYGAKVKPTEKANGTINESPEAGTMSWEFSTTPIPVTKIEDVDSAAHFYIDSTKVDKSILKTIEDTVYGTDDKEPSLPTIDELVTMLTAAG